MSAWTTAGLIADGTFDDPANARVIYLAVAGLVLLGVLLAVGTWWWWRSSKVEHPVLAPLEVMGTRKWWKADFHERQRTIAAARPVPVDADGAEVAVVGSADPVDLDHVLVRDDPHTFDDLVDPELALAAEVAAPVNDENAESASVAVVDPSADVDPAAEGEAIPEAEPVVEPEPVLAAEHESAVSAEPVAEPETVATPEPAMRSIVIDTAPRPRDTPSDLGPEAADSDPTPMPIDPLLRLQSD